MNTERQENREPTPGALPRPPSSWLMPVLFLAALTCGFVAGAAVSALVISQQVQRTVNRPSEMPRRVTERLRAHLGLTDEQVRQVKAILQTQDKTLREIRKDSWSRVKPVLDQTQREIEKVLTEEQAKRWRKAFQERRRHWMPARHGQRSPAPRRRRPPSEKGTKHPAPSPSADDAE